MTCVRVQDSIECGQRIRNGTADFGIFTAESTLHMAKLQWDGLTVVKELRHRDRTHSESLIFAFDALELCVNYTENTLCLQLPMISSRWWWFDRITRTALTACVTHMSAIRDISTIKLIAGPSVF